MSHYYIQITNLEELLDAQAEFRWKVKSGNFIPLWSAGNVPMFALAEGWHGEGVVLSVDELEELFDNQQRMYTARWN